MTRAYLLLCDIQRSVLAVADCSRAYTPYGASLVGCGPLLAHCGELEDMPTGFYHLGNGHRTFNPALMRFHSPDRLSPFGKGGIHAYAYCGGDPVNYLDRNGRNRKLNGVLHSVEVKQPLVTSIDPPSNTWRNNIVEPVANAVALVASGGVTVGHVKLLRRMWKSVGPDSNAVSPASFREWGVVIGATVTSTIASGISAVGLAYSVLGNPVGTNTSGHLHNPNALLDLASVTAAGVSLVSGGAARKMLPRFNRPGGTLSAASANGDSVTDRQGLIRDGINETRV